MYFKININENFKNKIKNLPFFKNFLIYFPSTLIIILMIFIPLFEKYAYKFLYASSYAFLVAFYAIFIKDYEVSNNLIFILRIISFVYTLIIAKTFNIGFAIIGFLTIYQITRFLDKSFFKNYIMTILIYFGIFYLSLPNHSGIWILIYYLLFIVLSTLFVTSHFIYFNKNRFLGNSFKNAFKYFTISFDFTLLYLKFALIISLVIFLITPRLSLNLANPFSLGRYVGMASTFDFNSISNLKESSQVIMRITKEPKIGNYYKMKSFNRYRYKQKEWIATGFGTRKILPYNKNYFIINQSTPEVLINNGTLVNCKYFIKFNPGYFVPQLDNVLTINAEVNQIHTDYIENLYIDKESEIIDTSSYIVNINEELLKNVHGPDPARIVHYYCNMFPKELYKVQRLAYKLTYSYQNRYEKAYAIMDYLKTNYKYSKQVGDLYDQYKNSIYDPNEVFLFIVKAGHCEFFASAMTLMCQSINIPARLVTGFASPQYNAGSDYYYVTGNDAHAWVEVYFPNIGFVIFDPVAFSLEDERKVNSILAFLIPYIDQLNFMIESYVTFYKSNFLIEIIKVVFKVINEIFKHLYYFISFFIVDLNNEFQIEFFKRFKFYILIMLPFLILVTIITFKPFLTSIFVKLLCVFLGYEIVNKILDKIQIDINKNSNFYAKFLQVMEKYNFIKLPYETPYEFMKRVKALNILNNKCVEECDFITEMFYNVKCKNLQLSKQLLNKIYLKIYKIDELIKKNINN